MVILASFFLFAVFTFINVFSRKKHKESEILHNWINTFFLTKNTMKAVRDYLVAWH